MRISDWSSDVCSSDLLTVYWSGTDWLDMCRGPHLPSTGKLDPQAFKLTRVSGAYWRGDQKNAMLSRIYGTGWLNRKQLDAHLHRLEEAAKRDHRHDRQSGVQGKSVSVRVGHGGPLLIQKKQK